MATLLEKFATLFHEHSIDCILIGGWAASVHVSMPATVDVDFVYARRDENASRLVEALSDLSPYLRGAPAGLPFTLDKTTIQRGLNFTLTTSLGDLDLLGEVYSLSTCETDILPSSST